MKTPKTWPALFLVSTLTGCIAQDGISTRRPYVFTDNSGRECRGYYVQPQMPVSMVGKTGQLVVLYENGRKWIEGRCVNGQFDGLVRMWREDGTLFVEDNYCDGKQHGKSIWWYAKGTKQMEVDWVDGKKNGLWLEWDENGNETGRRMVKDDREVK